jgi:hypothetical protein
VGWSSDVERPGWLLGGATWPKPGQVVYWGHARRDGGSNDGRAAAVARIRSMRAGGRAPRRPTWERWQWSILVSLCDRIGNYVQCFGCVKASLFVSHLSPVTLRLTSLTVRPPGPGARGPAPRPRRRARRHEASALRGWVSYKDRDDDGIYDISSIENGITYYRPHGNWYTSYSSLLVPSLPANGINKRNIIGNTYTDRQNAVSTLERPA